MVIIFLVNASLVAAAILIHYEMLYRLSNVIPRLTFRHRYRVVYGIFGAMVAHVIEIWLFSLGYYFLLSLEGMGKMQGNFDGSISDCVYYSFTTYSSLGLGDIEPIGPVRFLTGLEALTGLVLITWTASFMYLEMQRFWDKK